MTEEHFAWEHNLQVMDTEPSVSTLRITPLPAFPTRFLVGLRLVLGNSSVLVRALLDTGAMDSFVTKQVARCLNLITNDLPCPLTCSGFDSTPGGELVTKAWRGVGRLTNGVEDSDNLDFDLKVNDIGHYDVILGLPWLNSHQAIIHCGAEGRGVEIGSLVVFCDNNVSLSHHVDHPIDNDEVNDVLVLISEAEEVKKFIPARFHQFLDVFLSQETSLPPHRKHDVEIKLKEGCNPPNSRAYNLSAGDEAELKVWVDDQLTKGFIRPSSSPASAPAFLAKSPGRKNRPCIDYRGLNKMTVRDSYPIPLVKSLLSRIRECKRYVKIDLKVAFNLLGIKAGEKWKTAFRAPGGLYESLVFPFGLANGPVVFQRVIQDVLHKYLDFFVLCTWMIF